MMKMIKMTTRISGSPWFVMLAICMILSACWHDELIGKWDPMKWGVDKNYAGNASVKIPRKSGAIEIDFKDSGELQMVCSNYSFYWLAGYTENGNPGEHIAVDQNQIDLGWIVVTARGNRLILECPPEVKIETPQTLKLEVSAGDTFKSFVITRQK